MIDLRGLRAHSRLSELSGIFIDRFGAPRLRSRSLAALVCLLIWASTGCASRPGLESVVDAQGAVRFALLPVNTFVPTPPGLANASWRLTAEVERHLRTRGYERSVIEPALAAQLWQRSIEMAEASDSSQRDFHGAIRLFAAGVQQATPFDALVAPSLVYREARVRRQYAKWDGAVRKLEPPGGDAVEVPESFSGTAPALSLHLMIFDRDGELVFEDYSGLELAHDFAFDPNSGQLDRKLREEQLGSGRFVQEGVERAFEPFLKEQDPNGS